MVSGFTSNMTKVSKENVKDPSGTGANGVWLMGGLLRRKQPPDGLCTILREPAFREPSQQGITGVNGGLTERFETLALLFIFLFCLSGEEVSFQGWLFVFRCLFYHYCTVDAGDAFIDRAKRGLWLFVCSICLDNSLSSAHFLSILVHTLFLSIFLAGVDVLTPLSFALARLGEKAFHIFKGY